MRHQAKHRIAGLRSPRQLAIGLATAHLLIAAPFAAQANSGGGNACPWAQDATVKVGSHELTVPQTVFDAKSPQLNMEGYELVPSLHQLKLSFIGAYGDVWESALTRIDGGKRCLAFLVSQPVQVSEALPYDQRKSVSAATRR